MMRPCGSPYSLPMVPPLAKLPQVTVATYLFPAWHSLRSDTRYGYPSTEQCTSFSYRINNGPCQGCRGVYSVLSSLQAIMNSEKIIKKLCKTVRCHNAICLVYVYLLFPLSALARSTSRCVALSNGGTVEGITNCTSSAFFFPITSRIPTP